VLEALEASIASHPASGRREQGRSGAAGGASADAPGSTGSPLATVTRIDRHEGATVLRFVPRRPVGPHGSDAA
jgi:hypothetical protein